MHDREKSSCAPPSTLMMPAAGQLAEDDGLAILINDQPEAVLQNTYPFGSHRILTCLL